MSVRGCVTETCLRKSTITPEGRHGAREDPERDGVGGLEGGKLMRLRVFTNSKIIFAVPLNTHEKSFEEHFWRFCLWKRVTSSF